MSSVPTLNLCGAGRVGQTLARLWLEAGCVSIGGVLTRSLESAQVACDWIGAGTPCKSAAEMPAAEMVLIATSDTAIGASCSQLVAAGVVPVGSVVFHVSGALAAAELASAEAVGAWTASAHPARAFPHPDVVYSQFSGTACALEGDARALQQLTPLFAAIGGVPFRLASEQKVRYHAACVVASNYLVTVAHFARELALGAGLSVEQAQAVLQPLASGALANTFALGGETALTGPLVRGDVATLQRHLSELEGLARADYLQLGQQTFALAHSRLTAQQRAELTQLLQQGA